MKLDEPYWTYYLEGRAIEGESVDDDVEDVDTEALAAGAVSGREDLEVSVSDACAPVIAELNSTRQQRKWLRANGAPDGVDPQKAWEAYAAGVAAEVVDRVRYLVLEEIASIVDGDDGDNDEDGEDEDAADD